MVGVPALWQAANDTASQNAAPVTLKFLGWMCSPYAYVMAECQLSWLAVKRLVSTTVKRSCPSQRRKEKGSEGKAFGNRHPVCL